MFVRAWLILAIVVAFAAPLRAAAPDATGPYLVCWGDSISGAGGATSPSASYCAIAAKAMGLVPRNLSIAGSTLEAGDYRPDYSGIERYDAPGVFGLPALTSFAGANGNRFVLEYGINDVRLSNRTPGFSAEHFRSDYDTIVHALIAAGTPSDHIVLGELPFVDQSDCKPGCTLTAGEYANAERVFSAQIAAEALARRTRFASVYTALAAANARTPVLTDGLHPNDDGNVVIARQVAGAPVLSETAVITGTGARSGTTGVVAANPPRVGLGQPIRIVCTFAGADAATAATAVAVSVDGVPVSATSMREDAVRAVDVPTVGLSLGMHRVTIAFTSAAGVRTPVSGEAMFVAVSPHVGSIPPVGTSAHVGGIDFIAAMGDTSPSTARTIALSHDAFASIEGWSYDTIAAKPSDSLYVEVDGKFFYRAQTGFDRSDVAKLEGSPSYRFAGFLALIDCSELGKGSHTVKLVAVSADRTKAYVFPQPLTLTLS